MRKYVLNIDRLYTGVTSNALVLSQVDEELPVLIKQIMGSEHETSSLWLERRRKVYIRFDPVNYLERKGVGQSLSDIWKWTKRFYNLNSYIDDINKIALQTNPVARTIAHLTSDDERTFRDWKNSAQTINSSFLPENLFGWWDENEKIQNLAQPIREFHLNQLNNYLEWFNVPRITKNDEFLSGLVSLVMKSDPVLSQSVYNVNCRDIRCFVQNNYNASFNPIEEFGWWNNDLLDIKINEVFAQTTTNLSVLNDYILDFNLTLQEEFKSKGHSELYLMDDTQRMKPDEEDKSISSEKTYLHSLNGWKDIQRNETTPDGYVNSSQLNVIFPFKKTTNKSLYASQLKVNSAVDIDDILERSRNITLQGKVSYEKCVQSMAQAGNSLYVMSTMIDIGNNLNSHIIGNHLTVLNGYGNPYHFPNSMTLFQPSQKHYDGPNLSKVDGTTNFITWCKEHDRKFRVKLSDIYGGNVSPLKCLGPGSYEIDLATYGPTDIVLDNGTNREYVSLTSETFRKIRNDEFETDLYDDKTYVIDNRRLDEGDDVSDVGLMFNLYDTFITGKDRILTMGVPTDPDFNRLFLKFDCISHMEPDMADTMEVAVYINESNNSYLVFEGELSKTIGLDFKKTCSYPLEDAVVSSHNFQIVVRIHYQVDFGKRNGEKAYREKLRKSGVLLNNIRIENGIVETLDRLTFGSYLNESGISEDEREKRYDEFWQVSQYKKDIPYQTVLETSLRRTSTAGIEYPNNYSSGDIYADMFMTKSMLDPRYDMNIFIDPSNDNLLKAEGRDYIGLGQCSNQLSLFYKPIDVSIGYGEDSQDVVARRVNPEPELKYQMVEVVKNINRFESSIKHKSNVFSVVVENSNLAPSHKKDKTLDEEKLEDYKARLRDSITQFVRNTCESIVPVHTQLFDVQFT